MKAKLFLAAALVLVGSVAFASDVNETKLVVVRNQASDVFKVIFESQNYVFATVNIFDNAGNLVFQQDVKGKNGFILPMNFTGLTYGEYSIEVKQGSNSWKQTVNYETPVLEARNSSSSIQNVAVSKLLTDGKYLLSVSTAEEQFVRVNIFDTNDSLLHTETRKANGDLAIVYNVKDASGEVTFQVTDKLGYSKTIKK
ncbi:MAG TPA: hypothetical protein VFU05_13500 [Cyclobacteriaceae bacterium]|nr:hypothetical protein [Cyclobacteriaceae bacterium]